MPRDRRSLEQGPRDPADPRQPGGNCACQRRGQATGGILGGSQLLREQRVAIRATHDVFESFRSRLSDNAPRDKFRHRLSAEALKPDVGHTLVVLELTKETNHSLGVGSLVLGAERGGDEHARLAQDSVEEGQQLKRRSIGPVEILKDQQGRWSPFAQPFEDARETLKEPRARPGGCLIHGRGAVAQRWADAREIRASRPEDAAQIWFGDAPSKCSQGVNNRGERGGRPSNNRGGSGQYHRVPFVGHPDQLRDQPTLADAGLACHEDDARGSFTCVRQRALECRDLVRAPDQRRPQGTSTHHAVVHTLPVPPLAALGACRIARATQLTTDCSRFHPPIMRDAPPRGEGHAHAAQPTGGCARLIMRWLADLSDQDAGSRRSTGRPGTAPGSRQGTREQ
jgi:hypothetical protein